MKMNEYQEKAKEFVAFDEKRPMEYLLPALAEEVGELQAIFAKNNRKYGDYILSTDQWRELYKELGDILWNVAMIARYNGMFLEGIAYENIDKLQQRLVNNDIATIQR